MAEWFKAPVLKTGVPARVPWVRIPPLPPKTARIPRKCRDFDFLPILEPTHEIGRAKLLEAERLCLRMAADCEVDEALRTLAGNYRAMANPIAPG